MDRQTLQTEILDELTLQGPSAFMKLMRRWPSGSLSLVHLHVLMVLDGDGPQAMRALAEALDVSQASATGIVDRMEQRGLVARLRDDADRRVIRVALTDVGRNLLATVAADRRDRLAKLLAELSDDELAAFLVGSRALRRARERLLERLPSAARGYAVGRGPAPKVATASDEAAEGGDTTAARPTRTVVVP